MKISKSPADPVVGQTLSLTVSDMAQIQQKRGAEPVETTVEWRFDPPDMVSEVEESAGTVTFKAKATGKLRVLAVATMVDPGTGAESTETDYEDLTIEPHVGVVEGVYSAIRKIAEEGINVDAKPGTATEDQALWVVIRDCVRRRSYENYALFIDTVLCKKDTAKYERLNRQDDCSYIHGVQGYQLLKAATEVFLLCGSCCGDGLSITEFDAVQEEDRLNRTSSLQEMQATLESYLSDKVTPNTLPYLRQILNALQLTPGDAGTFPFCPDDTRTFPCLFELIWSYWHEEGMLVQTMNGSAGVSATTAPESTTGTPWPTSSWIRSGPSTISSGDTSRMRPTSSTSAGGRWSTTTSTDSASPARRWEASIRPTAGPSSWRPSTPWSASAGTSTRRTATPGSCRTPSPSCSRSAPST